MWKLLTLTIILAITAATATAVLAARDGTGGPAGGMTFPVDLNIQDDACEHDFFIFGGASHNMTLQVVIDGNNVTIDGPSPWVSVSGFLEVDQVFATGVGTVAGLSPVTVEFQGKLGETSLSGKYTMGANEELPPCDDDNNAKTPEEAHPAVYQVKPKATPTPQATGTPEKTFSITVLKLNEQTYEPLPGFEFNLYAGDGCQGSPIDQGISMADGLYDFTGLAPGDYSVEEKPAVGWNNVTDVCQDVSVGGTAGASGVPPCPQQPDEEHPQPGCDTFDSGARVIVRLNGTSTEFPVTLNGPTQIERKNKPADLDTNGLDEVETEIVHMELTGGGVTVRQSSSTPSLGKIEEQSNGQLGALEFPADSWFDVYFDVDVQTLQLHNEDPFRMECKIDEIPPVNCFYQPPIPDPIELYDGDGIKRATIVHAMHIPLPPNEVLVVFTNEPKGTPTPTPQATPTAQIPSPTPAGDYSITVVKLDTVTKEPLPGWQMNLFLGGGCNGSPIASGATAADGIIDFIGLAPGNYSVQEKLQPGWNPETDVCQDVTVAAAGAAGLTCPIVPDQPFPDAGCDQFNSGAQVNVDLDLDDIPDMTVTLNGPTTVTRSALSGTTVDTEIVQLDLTGGGVVVRQSPATQSLGSITNISTNQDSSFANGDSFFDIYFEVDVAGMTLHNVQPLEMECKINSLPPIFCLYQPDLPEPISLYDSGNVERARLVHGLHIPLPEGEVLVVFENRRKAGGDVNCDGTANSIDALFILQYIAGLLPELPCPEAADVNQDGEIDALDSLLILQYDAGLLPSLPPGVGGRPSELF